MEYQSYQNTVLFLYKYYVIANNHVLNSTKIDYTACCISQTHVMGIDVLPFPSILYIVSWVT